jgi:hypothetical protein
MQISDEHVVVVVVRRVVVVVVVVRRVVVVVVVIVGASLSDFAVVVVVVVVVLLGEDDDDAEPVVVVVVGALDGWAPGGMGSTAPASVGSRSGWSGPPASVPNAKSVHVIAPTTAPTASRPCPLCRVDPIGVLRVNPATTGS